MNAHVGIDVSKSKSSFCVMDFENGEKPVKEFQMSREGFDSLLEQTKGLDHPAFFMESTGRYHLTLLQYLLNHDQKTFIVNPVLVKNYSKAHTLRRTKTDIVDAKLIADFSLHNSDKLRKAEFGLIDEIRSMARRREQLAEEVAKAKTQLKADLSVAFPEILSIDVFTKGVLNLLTRYPSPRLILVASIEELSLALNEGTKGRASAITADKIVQMADDSIAIESYGPLVKDSAKNLMFIQEREKAVTDTFLDLVKKDHKSESDILESIPGIGKITAAHFLAEIGDIANFSRYQKLIAFCGTDPGIYQSGTILKQGHITKHGNKSLRKYVYLMAFGALKFNPFFRDYYDKKKKEGFSHRKAMVALMNKILKTIFAMLTKGEKFVTPK
ncbi:MAG: IS110 family transposase [Spirochaetaceae bacterium]|nr:IS110 family transposase [Spirochaetaceae bacterium]